MAGLPIPVKWEGGSLPPGYFYLPGAALWLAIENCGVRRPVLQTAEA